MRDRAEAHFQTALEVNERLGAVPWVVRTQIGYADMLLRRGHSADRATARSMLLRALETAERIGQEAVIEHATQLRHIAEGVVPLRGHRRQPR